MLILFFFGQENVFHLIILHKILEANFFSILNYQFLYFYIIHAIKIIKSKSTSTSAYLYNMHSTGIYIVHVLYSM